MTLAKPFHSPACIRPRPRWLSRSSITALALAAVTTAGMLLDAKDALATGLLPPQRYVACPRELPRVAQLPTPTAPDPDGDLLPLPRRKPRVERAAPRQEIDIVHWHPIPNAPPGVGPEPAPQLVFVQAAQLDYRCVGFERGKNGILRVLAAPPGTRYRNRSDWLAVNMAAAGMFNQRPAIVWLERQLARPLLANSPGYLKWQHRNEQLNAMRALAELGASDTRNAAAARALMADLEVHNNTMWRSALESFRRLAPAAAQRYAIEVLRRGQAGGSIQPLVDVAERLLNQPSAEAVAALRQVNQPLDRHQSDTTRTANCHLLAARLRMGDEALRGELVPELGQGLRTNRAAVCFSHVFADAFPYDRPDSIDAYILRRKYGLMVKWLAELRRLERAGKLPADWAAARQRLIAALAKMAASPHISGGRNHRQYVAADHGRLLLIRQALGQRVDPSELAQAIDPGDGRRMSRWIMALDALTLELPEAADRAAAALTWGISHHQNRIYPQFDRRSGHVLDEQGRVVEALAEQGDPRFVLGLLQRFPHAYSVTLAKMAKKRPAQACAIVTTAAKDANREQVERAFWALSLYGAQCEQDLLRVARDTHQPPHVISMAIESLAMIRSQAVPRLLERMQKPRKDHRARVNLMLQAPDEAPAPPLPAAPSR